MKHVDAKKVHRLGMTKPSAYGEAEFDKLKSLEITPAAPVDVVIVVIAYIIAADLLYL